MEDFFPKYPNIHKIKGSPYIDPYDDRPFNDVIVNKREFKELQLPKEESIAEKNEQFYHQKIITRFLSSKTPYDELLLFHDMGTGKTCTAISVIENIRYSKNNPYRGAMIFTRSVPLGRNFMNELFFKCTDGRYIPENYEKLTDFERIKRMNKIASQFYEFLTFEVFAKALKRMSEADMRAKYDNVIIVMDEVHNLRLKESDDEDLDIYNEFFRFLHALNNRKVLLLSGTPMKDNPAEIASVMNLILPSDAQFDSQNFNKDYFNDDSSIKTDKVVEFATRVSGRVSYLKSMSSVVRKVFVGESLGLKHFKVAAVDMSDFQSEHYVMSYRKDKEEKGVFTNSRQASLFVFPDGTYGADGFAQDRFILKHKSVVNVLKKSVQKTTYFLGPQLVKAINQDVANVYKYGCKLGYVIDSILKNEGKCFVYCEYVNGSGLILLSLLLDHFGFTKATGKEKVKGRRYALVSHQTSTIREIQRLIFRFNEPDNVDGEFISVILGSRVIAEGITLKNVTHEFILTPHWNYSETSQVISRGWRAGSHREMIERGDSPVLAIYQLVALLKKKKGGDDDIPSIDLEMYRISENKDVTMKQIEHIIKRTSFDCPLNIRRNKLDSGFDGMRECDYTSCDYRCSGTISGPTDNITYNLYYSTAEEVYKKLKAYFQTNFSIQMNQLYEMFPHNDKFEINKSINDLINVDVQFTNKYGFACYLREKGDTVYITIDPNKVDEYLTEYYTKNVLLTKDIDYEQMVVDMYVGDIPKRINDIFTHPQYMRSMITALPENAQIILLQGSILSDLRKIEKNKEIRKEILSYFDGFYGKQKGKWTVWYAHETEGSTCLDESSGEWVSCDLDRQAITNIEKKDLLKSPVGYIGLYNPKIDAFCIRDVNLARPSDLRKLTVGKMCKDWKVKDLVDIANRMNLKPPKDFMKGISIHKLREHTARLRQFRAEDLTDKTDVELKRMIYFSKNRETTCAEIKKWFVKHKLMKEDLDCGQQTKKRFRVI